MAFLRAPLFAITVCLLSVQGAFGSPKRLEERATCDADNLLRLLRASSNSAAAATFCSKYISLPLVTTVTTVSTSTVTADTVDYIQIDVHPLYLYNIQPQIYGSTVAPISYNSASPTPSTVPGDPQIYGYPYGTKVKAREPDPMPTRDPRKEANLNPRATTSTLSTPTFIATTYPPSRLSSACSCLSVPFSSTKTVSKATTTTTTSSCRFYDEYAWTSVPAFCGPTAQANVPRVVSSPPNIKTVSPVTVSDKLACCAACVKIFNCVWWTFTFSNPSAPDPWAPGKCTYAYNIASLDNPQEETPAICPNGLVHGLLGPNTFSGKESANFAKGYNQGPCGDALGAYQSSQDFGYPDDDPSGNDPQC